MVEVHGWITLRETYEVTDEENLEMISCEAFHGIYFFSIFMKAVNDISQKAELLKESIP
ncbi:MAG: hypothetical protein K2M78_08405 [Lachnospiraceae bacterium]|nr:hypothetical protein [Lachnospiraceae bacterium]